MRCSSFAVLGVILPGAGVGVGAVGVDEAVEVVEWYESEREGGSVVEVSESDSEWCINELASPTSAFPETHVLRKTCWVNSVHYTERYWPNKFSGCVISEISEISCDCVELVKMSSSITHPENQ
jgi:hypothetical protein